MGAVSVVEGCHNRTSKIKEVLLLSTCIAKLLSTVVTIALERILVIVRTFVYIIC